MKIFRFLLCKYLSGPNVSSSVAQTAATKVIKQNAFIAWTYNTKQALFGKYLLHTNIISSGVLMLIGDLMSQEIEYRKGLIKERYDWLRTGKMFLVGTIQGPIHHYFYAWLDQRHVGATLKITTIKILYDQFIMSPVCIAAFFYPAGWLDGQSTAACTNELLSKFPKVYATDWLVWPATQFINFYYLHPQYRVVYVNFITMLYNVFLSYVKHDHGIRHQTPPLKLKETETKTEIKSKTADIS